MLPENSFTFRIVSFNIRYGSADDGKNCWEYRAHSLAQLLQETNADLIALQEALNFQLDYIQEYLRGWHRLGVGRDDGAGGGEHCAILFDPKCWRWLDNGTFWLSETLFVPGSKSWNSALPRICTWAKMQHVYCEKIVYIFNTHFDHESSLARKNSASLIAQYLKNVDTEIPIVLCGDFNESLDGAFAKELCYQKESILKPAWQLAYPKTPMPATFHNFEGKKNGIAIDHMFINKLLKVQSFEIGTQQYENRWPSDHFPLIVQLSLNY